MDAIPAAPSGCALLGQQLAAEPRLQRRYQALVASQLSPAQSLAAGIRVPAGLASGFAATQAAWRFFANPRLTLPELARPLIACAAGQIQQVCGHHLLVVLDWCNLHLNRQASRCDRTALTQRQDLGYELLTALALSDRGGEPLAPLCLELKAAAGLYSTRSPKPLPAVAHLDGLEPVMRHLQQLQLGRPAVFIIDREADSIAHLRAWEAAGMLYLIRADNQPRVIHQLRPQPLKAVAQHLREHHALHPCGKVLYQGAWVSQWVGETSVLITRPARTHRKDPSGGKTRHRNIAGPALPLRLVVSELRDEQGQVLACWLLLTNLSATQVSARQVALWYYWRWRIESYHKLLKSAGQQVEYWQQQEAGAFARRLLVGAMAAVVVWHLARQDSPAAQQLQQVLVRLSGRQIKRGSTARTFTEPALFAGLGVLLPMLDLLQEHDPEDLRALLQQVLPGVLPPPPRRTARSPSPAEDV